MAAAVQHVVPLTAVNAMDRAAFLAAFGDIAGKTAAHLPRAPSCPDMCCASEKSEWVAERAHAYLPVASKVLPHAPQQARRCGVTCT